MPAKFRRLIRVPKKKTDKLENRRCSILNATSQDQNLLENTLFYDKIAVNPFLYEDNPRMVRHLKRDGSAILA